MYICSQNDYLLNILAYGTDSNDSPYGQPAESTV